MTRYYANVDAERASNRRWQAANREQSRECSRSWRVRNPEAYSRLRKTWDLRNLALRASYSVRRYTAKKNRTPSWLTQEHFWQIEFFYYLADSVTKETGVPHSVDHVVPLQGSRVSGLHVPWNLQVITRSENSRKGNSFDVS